MRNIDVACKNFKEKLEISNERNKNIALAERDTIILSIEDVVIVEKKIRKLFPWYRIVTEDQGDRILRNTDCTGTKDLAFIRGTGKEYKIKCYDASISELVLKYVDKNKIY